MPLTIFTLAGEPTVAVALKSLGATPLTVAVAACGPGTVPSVHAPAVATPSALDGAIAPVIAPLPAVTAKFTTAPVMGLSYTSATRTASAVVSALPTTATCRSPLTTVTFAGGPTVAVAAKVAASATPDVEAVSVWAPGTVPTVHAVAAVPSVEVTTVAGLTVPLPTAGANVTLRPATAFPRRSCSFTLMVFASTAPTVAVCASPATLIGASATCETVTGTRAVALPARTTTLVLPLPTAATVALVLPETVATSPASVETVGATDGMAAPCWSSTITAMVCVAPSASNERLAGEAVMVVGTGGAVVSLPVQAATATTTAANAAPIERRCGPKLTAFAQGTGSTIGIPLTRPDRH